MLFTCAFVYVARLKSLCLLHYLTESTHMCSLKSFVPGLYYIKHVTLSFYVIHCITTSLLYRIIYVQWNCFKKELIKDHLKLTFTLEWDICVCISVYV